MITPRFLARNHGEQREDNDFKHHPPSSLSLTKWSPALSWNAMEMFFRGWSSVSRQRRTAINCKSSDNHSWWYGVYANYIIRTEAVEFMKMDEFLSKLYLTSVIQFVYVSKLILYPDKSPCRPEVWCKSGSEWVVLHNMRGYRHHVIFKKKVSAGVDSEAFLQLHSRILNVVLKYCAICLMSI